jgi:hypothetical protein
MSEFKDALEAANVDQQIDDLRKALDRTRVELAKTKAWRDEMVEVIQAAAYDAMISMGPIPPVPAPKKDSRRKKIETALIHTTDWQGGKRTETYDSNVMHRRVMQFAEKCVRITEIQRSDHPVKHCVVMMGGDMVEGVMIFPGQSWEVDSGLVDQWLNVSRTMVEFLRYLLGHFETVTVFSEHGNHGRIGTKRDGLPRHDNVDLMCYHLARKMLQDEPRIIWDIDTEDIKRVTCPALGRYAALLIHGDEVGRGGFSSPMTIVRHADRWQSGAYDLDFTWRDLFVGHYHQHQEWNMANGVGTVFMSASTESSNRYARDLLAANGTPSQRLLFVDPEKGRVTANYRVWLD